MFVKILVLSDIHDNIWNLEKVISEVKGKVDLAIFCGDFCAPFSVGILANLNIPVYVCLGNNDEDHIAMVKRAGNKVTWVSLSEEFGRLEEYGRKISFCHYPKLAGFLAKSGEYDAVFYGHTHIVQNEHLVNTLLLNPGSVCGIIKGKPATASYAIYDTSTNTALISNI